MISGPHVHCIESHFSSRFSSDVRNAATRLAIKGKDKVLSYTEKKMENTHVYNVERIITINGVLYGYLTCNITICIIKI